ncbi:MAG: Nif3-like dinuclear metal center hexameric protein [Halobacteriales archaeon]
MDLGTLADRLDDRLDVEAYAGVDASANGLQVGRRDRPVERVAVAVDAAVEPIERAADADALVVHHGIVWGDGLPDLTAHRLARVRGLLDHDLGLYCAHLPLDGHPDLGNAARLGAAVGLTDTEAFGHLGGVPTGVVGRLPDAPAVDALVDRVAAAVDRESDAVGRLGPTPASVDRLAIVTGSGTDLIEEAAAVGADALLTGEPKHSAYHRAVDLGVCTLTAGHYATETFGVRAVAELVAEWGLETRFVDVPTGL